MTIHEMIKFYRMRDGLSQAELAQKIKVTPAAIGNYESGTRKPKPEIEEALADLFNVSIDNLRGIDSERISTMVPGTGELLELFARATPEVRQSVLQLLRSCVAEQNNS